LSCFSSIVFSRHLALVLISRWPAASHQDVNEVTLLFQSAK